MTVLENITKHSPAFNWLPPKLMTQLIADMTRDPLCDRVCHYLQNTSKNDPRSVYTRLVLAQEICQRSDLDLRPDKSVFFSGATKTQAEKFIAQNPSYEAIHTRPAGAFLELLNLFDPQNGIDYQDAYQAWFTIAARYSEAVQGNVTAILEAPAPEKTFRKIELGLLLTNDRVETINSIPKEKFSSLISADLTSFVAETNKLEKIVNSYKPPMSPPSVHHRFR
jgi:hypothetical protein